MKLLDALLLVALSAIWGSSFIFMRILSPVLGPVVTAAARLGIAGLFIVAFFTVAGFRLEWRRHWKLYLLVGIVNSAVPFLLYAFAALFIPASLSVVLNSTAPMFGALFAAVWLGDRLTTRKIAGLAVGIAGVSLVTGFGAVGGASTAVPAILACLLAASCYGFAGVFIRRKAAPVSPRAMAGASQLLAGLVLLPLIAVTPPREPITAAIGLYAAALALLCTGIAYLIYYRLLASVGPTRALTVTFLMPAFGMLWGALFLHERITAVMAAGAVVTLFGTYLVAVSPRRRAEKRRAGVADGP